MKIALVVHDFLRGVGHGRYCIELAQRFSREHEVYVFANRFDPDFNFRFHRRSVPAWRTSAVTSILSFIGAAENLLRREQFDVVHAQGLCCRRADVITAHVCNAARYRRAPAKSLVKRVFPALVIPRERKFYAQSNKAEVIAVSKAVQRELEEEYGCCQTSVIYHGVNAIEFSPAPAEEKVNRRTESGLPLQKWIWMFAGEAAKGLEETIHTLTEFPEAHLVVVSRAPLRRFQDLAANLRVSQRITFQDATDRMTPIYQAADLFVYPSRYDTFGMVVAEAMACGLPVVAGKDIGAAEWIQHRENGIICSPDDVASQIRWIANQPAGTITEIGKHARRMALNHTWDDCAARVLEVYQRAIANKRNKR
jgi:glycosyltransferase involved in cell wall biosynthesis